MHTAGNGDLVKFLTKTVMCIHNKRKQKQAQDRNEMTGPRVEVSRGLACLSCITSKPHRDKRMQMTRTFYTCDNTLQPHRGGVCL